LNSTWKYQSKGNSTVRGCMTACNKSPKCTGFEFAHDHSYCALWFGGSCDGPGAKGWHSTSQYTTYISCAAPKFKPAVKTPELKGYLNLGGMHKACRGLTSKGSTSQYTVTKAAKNSTKACATKCSAAGSKCNGFEYYAPTGLCKLWHDAPVEAQTPQSNYGPKYTCYVKNAGCQGLCGPTVGCMCLSDKAPYCNVRTSRCSASNPPGNPGTYDFKGALVAGAKGYGLIKSSVTCNSDDKYLGEYSNVAKCAAACRAEVGCEFFVFNVMDSTGRCYFEKTAEPTCAEGFDSEPGFNFYGLSDQASTSTGFTDTSSTSACKGCDGCLLPRTGQCRSATKYPQVNKVSCETHHAKWCGTTN